MISVIDLKKMLDDHNLNSKEIDDFCEKYPLQITSYCGYANCRLCEKKDNGDGTVYWTAKKSGRKWIFPTGYFHYILEHNIEVPIEFVNDILENDKPHIVYDNYDSLIIYELLCRINLIRTFSCMKTIIYSI